MIIKTKKHALDKNLYIKTSLIHHMKTQWYWLLIPLAVFILGLILHFTGVYKNIWIPIVSVIGAILYVAFWGVQFMGVTQLEQNKQLFDKFIYEIDSRQILAKINAKEGGIIKWDMIKSVEKTEKDYLLHISKGQFLQFPFSIFTSDNDLRFFESILKRKELL
jgi:hypothetical protein